MSHFRSNPEAQGGGGVLGKAAASPSPPAGAGFYPDTGEIESIGGRCCGSGAVPPAGSRGRSPGHGIWGAEPPEAGSFLLHK